MNQKDEAFVFLPEFHLIKRDIKWKKGKIVLENYKLSDKEILSTGNLNLLYKILPDIFIPHGNKELKEALKNNKFKWLSLLVNEYKPPRPPQSKDLPATYKSRIIEALTAQPLIVGLGESSPYETGITLDFLTGLPIIPGSALKGITRRAAIMKLTGKTDILPYGEEFKKLADKGEKPEDTKNDDLKEIFGTEDKKGKVIFFDAYPIDWPDGKLFRLDVMNPHYGPYYDNPAKHPPADWYNPVPVFYLTVNTGVKYRFLLASKDEKALDTAKNWLKFALEYIGVGAKGAQGYGVFKDHK